ncbi:hypothetical protein LINPERHAP1_LOCUS32736 [Linum perenne]
MSITASWMGCPGIFRFPSRRMIKKIPLSHARLVLLPTAEFPSDSVTRQLRFRDA